VRRKTPQIVVCVCEGCLEGGQRPLGLVPSGVTVVHLPCSRDFELAHILRLILGGAEGVVIVGCAEGGQWGAASDYAIEERLKVMRCRLEQAGLAPDRVAASWVPYGEWSHALDAVNDLRTALGGTI